MGVAISVMSWQEMQECEMRGKGFRILHLFGDKLWYVHTYACMYIYLPVHAPEYIHLLEVAKQLH